MLMFPFGPFIEHVVFYKQVSKMGPHVYSYEKYVFLFYERKGVNSI